MRRLAMTLPLVAAITGNVYGQHHTGYNRNVRPQWSGSYNGRGFTPGYSYNPYSGWNTISGPGGAIMHYRDGYVPLRDSNYSGYQGMSPTRYGSSRPSRYRRYRNYNNGGNSQLNAMGNILGP